MGKALEVSHKSAGKRQRAARARLYIINKDVEEVQAACCCGYCYSGLHHSRAEIWYAQDNQSKTLCCCKNDAGYCW